MSEALNNSLDALKKKKCPISIGKQFPIDLKESKNGQCSSGFTQGTFVTFMYYVLFHWAQSKSVNTLGFMKD